MGAHELGRATWTRWRWRLRGAAMWPTFVLCVVLDTVLLHVLPISGAATGVSNAFIEAGFFNLVAVAVLGPLLGLGLRRLRPDLPRVVANNDAGAVMLLLIAVAVLGGGLLNRPAVQAADGSFRAQGQALVRYVSGHAPALRRNLPHADTVQLATTLYRTCVPADDPPTALCLFIDTAHSPPSVRRDTDTDPNWRYFLGHPGDYAGP